LDFAFLGRKHYRDLCPAQCQFCKAPGHFAYCANNQIRKLIAAQVDLDVKRVATEYANSGITKVSHKTLVDFFQATYGCSLPEEVELVFATCPVKRTGLERTLTQRLQAEADRRAEKARLEAEKLAEEARLEAEKRAEEARLEAEEALLEAEQQAAYDYAMTKLHPPKDWDWEWWLSEECLAQEEKFKQEYFVKKEALKNAPKQVSDKAKRRAANAAAAAQREADRQNRLKELASELSAQKAEKMKHYIPSGW
jgi:cell division septum initiation protein DivIVA